MKHFLDRLIKNPVLKIIISTLGTFITFLLGGFDLVLNSFVVLLLIDLITGILKASKQNRISSYIGRQGE